MIHELLRLISFSINLSSAMFKDTEPKLEFIELLFNSHFKPLWFSVNYNFIYKKIDFFNFLIWFNNFEWRDIFNLELDLDRTKSSHNIETIP